MDELLFDDELRIVSNEGEEFGEENPTPLPDDSLFDDDSLPGIVVEQSSERIVPILVEEEEEELEQEERFPLPPSKKAKGDLLAGEELQLGSSEQVIQISSTQEVSSYNEFSSVTENRYCSEQVESIVIEKADSHGLSSVVEEHQSSLSLNSLRTVGLTLQVSFYFDVSIILIYRCIHVSFVCLHDIKFLLIFYLR